MEHVFSNRSLMNSTISLGGRRENYTEREEEEHVSEKMTVSTYYACEKIAATR